MTPPIDEPDWLSEVLDKLDWEITEQVSNPPTHKHPFAEMRMRLSDTGKEEAHKLISAQLIREKIKWVEEVTTYAYQLHEDANYSKKLERHLEASKTDLTNKLKELEDEKA